MSDGGNGPGRVVSVPLGPYSSTCPEDRAVGFADEGWRPGDRRHGVVICHSAGQRAAEQANPDWWPVPAALAASGTHFCVACEFGDPAVDQGTTSGPHSWGNDLSLALMDEAVALLRSDRVGAEAAPVVLLGTSMGALVALGWARQHRPEVAGVVIACPVLQLEELYRADVGGFSQSVAAAYGLSPGQPLPAPGEHDPWHYAAELSGLPIRVYASADDPVAANTAACRQWAEKVGGGAVSVVDLGPAGHWPVGTPVDDALAFVGGLAG